MVKLEQRHKMSKTLTIPETVRDYSQRLNQTIKT